MKPLVADVKWNQRSIRSKLTCITAVIWTLFTLGYLSNIFFYLGIVLYPVTYRTISSGLICALVYFVYIGKTSTKSRREDKLKWYDILAVLVILIGCGYIAVNADDLIAEGRLIVTPFEMVIASLLFIVIIEAIRRTTGLILTGLITFFFFYTIYSNHFPGFLKSTGFSYSMAIGWMYLSAEGIWGMVLGVVSTVVAGFIIFGGFLRTIGAAQFFNDLALATAGTLRGGAAKGSVIASTFFGTISGSTAANVATTGQITIPLMKETGYKPNYAGAVEATASLGGMFMPPVMGATAFLIAEFLQINYWSVCVAAFLPALAYYTTLLTQVDLQAAKTGLKGLPKEDIPSIKKTLKGGWQYLFPFALLLFLLGGLRYSTQSSIMYTLAALIFVSFFKKETRITPKRLLLALEDSAKGMLPIIPLCTGIGILIGAIHMTGAGTKFTSELLTLSGGNLFLLLIMAGLAAFILGMGMTAVGVYILTVVLIAPALIKAGIEPIAAHMFLFYFGCLSFITPPVCVDAYIAAGIANGNPFRTGFQAMQLGFAAYLVPWAFIFNPGILWIGSAFQIVSAFVFITLGAVTMGVVFEGYLLVKLKIWERCVLTVFSLLVFIPAVATRIIGVVLLAAFVFNQFRMKRRIRAKS